ncbi:MAG: acyl-CoA dehydrogenase family protein [Deltaproteobacteria bacterium]|nr:MAG: acyl-CoA dehydrogenase family protein [Deltaproteobacteria bacterium]
MNSDTFLKDIYLGSFDMKKFHSFKDLGDDERTREIINQYRELTEEYPALYLEEERNVPPELLEKLKEIGFFGLNLPQAYGGVGLDLWQYLKVVEELTSRDLALALISLAHLSIGCKGIVIFGNEEQRKKYLVPAAAGEMIFSYALTEPNIGSDAKNIQTTAILSEDGSHYVLNGQKTYITNANYAGGLTVFAQLDPEKPGFMGAFIVETSWDGVKIGRDMPKMGLKACSTAAIQFKDVPVPVENLLGKPGDGFKIAMSILNYGRLALCAGSAGAMSQSLLDMEKRSATRTQFGVPINSFELIQEKLVQARVNSYVASTMTAFTAGLLAENPKALVAIESSHCKLFGTTRAWSTIYDALQVAGGSGYLTTQPYEKRMRDFRVTTIFEGTTEIHSIYPSLFMLRDLSRQIAAGENSKISRLVFLVKGIFGKTAWKPRFSDRAMNRAVRLVKANGRRIRWMLHAGMLLYGRKIQEKQFLLRRITQLSLYLYAIVCVLARVEAAKKKGLDVSDDLTVLAYFTEEAHQARKADRTLFTTRKESLHKKVFKAIIS